MTNDLTQLSDAELRRLKHRARRLEAKAAGLCSACCQRPVQVGFASCTVCLERRRAGDRATRRT